MAGALLWPSMMVEVDGYLRVKNDYLLFMVMDWGFCNDGSYDGTGFLLMLVITNHCQNSIL